MVFTSVLGHLFSIDFENKGKWSDVDPEALFTGRIVKHIQPELMKIKENIEREALKSDMVIVWTDCDREGENIGRQIRDVVHGVKDILVRRARFSGITLGEIENALRNLDDINEHEADAVDARMELDLRIGSAFTRLQTLAMAFHMEKRILSFGPCQIPTLGFVVERARERERFIEEKFWSLEVVVKRSLGLNKGCVENVFSWERGCIFDKNCVLHFYNHLLDGRAIVIEKRMNEKIKYRPLPLRTVEMQKICTSYFKLSGHKVMEIAEGLYNKGYISYPRTETDVFNKSFDFKDALGRLVGDRYVGEYVGKLLKEFKYPRSGKNDDMAHSPIYPLRCGNGLTGDDRNVYDFVCRRFLGCLSKDARGMEVWYRLRVKDEIFGLKGIKVLERNYLEVYHYDKWDDKEVSEFSLDEVVDGELYIRDGKTTPPNYLTEAELVTLMDKNGIGTDATIHEHILKIQERGYAAKAGNEIRPSGLGMALIGSYEEFGLEVSKPLLRKNLEINLKRICDRKVERDLVVSEEVKIYRGLYKILKDKIERFVMILRDVGVDEECNEDKHGTAESSRRSRCDRPEDTLDASRNVMKNRKRRTLATTSRRTAEQNMSNTGVMCGCKLPARVSRTKKWNNSEREFYCCYYFPRKCVFFQWLEDVGDQSVSLLCFCGFEPQLLVANTNSNKGRRFYKCKKAFKPCKFFQWEE